MDETDLLRSAHHAVRSPLGSIFNVTEMMLLGMDGRLSPDQHTSVTCIVDDTQRLHRVGEALLDYLRLVESSFRPRAVDVALLVRAATEQIQSDDAMDVSLLIQTDLPHWQADPDRFHDLMIRALRYVQLINADGKISVQVESEEDTLDIHIGELPLAGASPSTLPDILFKAERGILFLTCRRLTAILGGVLHLDCSPGGRIALSARFAQS